MLKNVFLDRDGVVNEIVMRSSLVSSPRTVSEFKIRTDFFEFHELAKKARLRLFVVSNQPDVARGLLTDSELRAMTEQMQRSFDLQRVVYCCHDDHHACTCRKPKPGMIISLLKDFDLSPEESVIVGDSNKDILAGQAAGLRTVLLSAGYNRDDSNLQPNFAVNRLSEIFALNL